jgi:hypothetical protein
MHTLTKMPVAQSQFEKTIAALPPEPTRTDLYHIGLKMVGSEFEIEAYLLILATWNFAGFRYALTNFDLKHFRKTITTINPVFARLLPHSFETVDFNLVADDIESIYSRLRPLVGQTGASKIMHFKHPKLFVMWDTGIRRLYKIPNSASARNYLDFLRLMRSTFGHLRWTQLDRSFAKAIDEYNFALVHPKRDRTNHRS